MKKKRRIIILVLVLTTIYAPTPVPTPKKYSISEIEDQAAYSLYVKLKDEYKNINGINLDATTYSIGSVTEVKNGNYEVKGTFSVYDDYGRVIGKRTFHTLVTPGSKSPSLVFLN